MRVTLALGGADDIAATATYPNNFVFGGEVLAELDNVARNPAGNGLPGGSTDGTWQVMDVEVTTGAEQTSLTIAVQNDHHQAGIFVPFFVDDITIDGWGLGLDPWVAFDVPDHSSDSFRLSTLHSHNTTIYSCKIDATGVFAGIQQIINLNPNTKYTVTGYAYVESVVAGDTYRLVARQNDAAQTLIGTTADIAPVADSWVKFEFVATAPNVDDLEAIIRFAYTGSNDPAPVYVDTFSVVPGEPASTAGVILNDVLDAMALVGKLTYLSRTFTNTEDSRGKPWPAHLSLDLDPTESLYGLLSRLVALGHEWEIVPDNFVEGGDTGFSLNVYTARAFNPESGIGTSHINDPEGPVITPGSAVTTGRVVKTAFNVNTVFAMDPNGVWSQAQQFPYETVDLPPSDPAPAGYKDSYGIIEDAVTVPASDASTISQGADARLSEEKGKERAVQIHMQRTSDIRPFLHIGVGDSTFVDMPPHDADPPDSATGLRSYPKRIRAIQASLSGEGADVGFVLDVDRVIYEDELAWLARLAQLSERTPSDNTGQGTGVVSGSGSSVRSSAGGFELSAVSHRHALTGTEITDKATSGDVSGTLPGPITVNKIKGMPFMSVIPTEDLTDPTLFRYDYDLNVWVPTVVVGGASPLTTKGDVYGYDTADARVSVGADGQVLTADSAQALGVKWAPSGGGGGGGAVPAWMSHLADRTVGGETVHADDDEFDDASIAAAWSNVAISGRSEERRVGKECRSRWSPYH